MNAGTACPGSTSTELKSPQRPHCRLIFIGSLMIGVVTRASALLPNPPVTRNQVELTQVDNVCSPGVPGFAELGISPHSVENMLEQTLRSR